MQQKFISVRVEGDANDIITNFHPFFDIQGRCYLGLSDDAMDDYQAVYTTFGETDSLWDVYVLILDESGHKLIGWYEKTIAYPKMMPLHVLPLDYIFTCNSQNACLLHMVDWPTLPDNLYSSKYVNLLNSDSVKRWIAEIKANAKLREVPINLKPVSVRYPTTNACLNKKLAQYEEEGDIKYAIDLLLCAEQLGKDNIEALDLAGYALMELAFPEQAMTKFEKVLEKQPNNRQPSIDKGECLIRLQRFDDAVAWFNKVFIMHPDDEMRLLLAQAYGLAGFNSTAQQLLKSITDPEIMEEAERFIRNSSWMSSDSLSEADTNLQPYPLINAYESKIDIKTVISHSGEKGFLDPIRGKVVRITPEETVRQHLLQHLLIELNIPRQSILVEESLAHLDRSLRDRVDILVRIPNGTHLMLTECKAPGVQLQGEPSRQLMNYNRVVKAPYIMLTNGRESYVYNYQENSGTFEAMHQMPDYQMMLDNKTDTPIYSHISYWKRPAFSELNNIAYQEMAIFGGMLGEGTSGNLRPSVLNLCHALLDEKRKIPTNFEIPGHFIIEDRGCLYLSLGNASGSGYPGRYRWLVAHDTKGKTHNVYMAVFGTGLTRNKSGEITGGGYTSLVCGSEENGKVVSRLQINLDRFLIPDIKGHQLTHNGKRAKGTIESMIDFISQQTPTLLDEKKTIQLGWLDTRNELRLSEIATARVIGNLVVYILLRSRIRSLEGQKATSM